MTLQEIIGYIILGIGILLGILILKSSKKEDISRIINEEKYLPLFECMVYFLATMGVSDFLQNTIIIRKKKLIDDKDIPHTLLTTTVFPSSLIACLFLKNSTAIDLNMLILFVIFLIFGAIVGSYYTNRIDGKIVKKIMCILLCLSLIAIIYRLVAQNGPQTLTSLSGIKLVILCIAAFFMAFSNMLGVPMKPICATVLLLLGVSPIVSLSLLQVLGAVTPLAGSINAIREKRYSMDMALSGITGGSIGAILGVAFSLTLSQIVINILLIIVILIAIVSLIKK